MKKRQRKSPRFLRPGLPDYKIFFKELIQKLKDIKYLLVNIENEIINSSSLTLYSWMKKGEPAEMIIREITPR